MSPNPIRLLLSGYYGFGNFGDEAILEVFVRQWRARRPSDEICVLAEDVAAVAGAYGVTAIPRADKAAVERAIGASHVVVSGGGGLLQSATSLRSLLYYTWIIREAKRAGRAAAIFAQGIGPLDFVAKQIVKRACADVDLAIVRDAASKALLAPLIPKVEVEVGADPVFLAPTAPDDDPEAAVPLEKEGVLRIDGDLVTVVVRKSSMLERSAAQIAGVVDRLAAAHRAHVVFVPFQPPQDTEAAIEVIRRCSSAPTLLVGGYALRTMTSLIARSAAVVSMRLHGLILAARLGVPMLALPYDPKVRALLDELDYPLPPLERDSSPEDAADRLWAQRAELGAHLQAPADALARRAKKAFDRLEALAEREGARVGLLNVT